MDTAIDWSNLPFGYFPTDYNVRCTFKDGKWGPVEVSQSDTINIHMAATCLHYGQEVFEGLKAFSRQRRQNPYIPHRGERQAYPRVGKRSSDGAYSR